LFLEEEKVLEERE